MLGDYVNTPKGIFRVTMIQDNDVVFTDYSDGIEGGFDIEDLAPVEITLDILLACGFCTSKRDDMHGWLVGDHYRVEYKKSTAQSGKVLGVQFLSKYSGYVKTTFNLPLPAYVHDLQHSMRVCGIKDFDDFIRIKKGGSK